MNIMDRYASYGHWQQNAPLGAWSWFGAGGAAQYLFEPHDEACLSSFLRDAPQDMPRHVVGGLSNVIVRDGGIRGIVIRLKKNFAHCQFEDGYVKVGAGFSLVRLAHLAVRKGQGGLEFLSGIPGTIGGAIRMNAGAFGCEMCDIIKNVTALDDKGNAHTLEAAQCGFGYRTSNIAQGWVITRAMLKTSAMPQGTIKERLHQLRNARRRSQPVRVRTGGSTFKNPPHKKAWQLIDEAGCRHFTQGDAILSSHHCNFMVNRGDAKAQDLEQLGLKIQESVALKTGITLEWEIERMGVL